MKINKLELVESISDEPVRSSIDTISRPDFENEQPKKNYNTGLWAKLWHKRRLQRPQHVAVLYLRNNGTAEPMEVECKDGFFNIGNKVYHANRDCLYTLGKERIPLVMIPEWSMIPVGTKDWDDKELREKFFELEDHLLKGIRHAEIVRMGGGERQNWGGMNPKAVVGIVIALIVAAVFLKDFIA